MDIKVVVAKVSPFLLMLVALLEKLGFVELAGLLNAAGSSLVAVALALWAIYDYVSKNYLHKADAPETTFKVLK